MSLLTRLFNRDKFLKDDLVGIKVIKVNGHKFKIKKINPLLDFDSDSIPQIFTYYQNLRPKPKEQNDLSPKTLKKCLEDMKTLVKIGVVEPRICPEIITIDDIFRWGDTGQKLYIEILSHSLNQFRGLKGVFFSIKIRLSLYTLCRKNMEELRLKSFSLMDVVV